MSDCLAANKGSSDGVKFVKSLSEVSNILNVRILKSQKICLVECKNLVFKGTLYT